MIGMNRTPHLVEEEKQILRDSELMRELQMKETPSFQEVKKRCEIIQSSSFWAQWPNDQMSYKVESAR